MKMRTASSVQARIDPFFVLFGRGEVLPSTMDPGDAVFASCFGLDRHLMKLGLIFEA
jgi:hypothetical protein